MEMKDERRNFHRVDFITSASVNYQNEKVHSDILDISINGIHFTTPKNVDLAINEESELAITLGNITIQLTVFILRKTTLGYAGNSLKMSPVDFSMFKRLLLINLGSEKLINKDIEKMVKLNDTLK